MAEPKLCDSICEALGKSVPAVVVLSWSFVNEYTGKRLMIKSNRCVECMKLAVDRAALPVDDPAYLFSAVGGHRSVTIRPLW